MLLPCRYHGRAAFSISRNVRLRFQHSSALQLVASTAVQSYVSTSDDPYINLSLENYLLQQSPADSAVLLLYANRPCVVIGRNQNPWLEVNLPYLKSLRDTSDHTDLVRRRSGGGTVFHDAGNVNWTVISPSKQFTRDKHVEMVVRALRQCSIDRARVNERHDIVLDQGPKLGQYSHEDMHHTQYGDSDMQPRKVSGSAYKLTRHRALHHGTCLLNSTNIGHISKYLRSELKPYLTAKGVESVSSPVANIGISNQDFMLAVQEQFARMYASVDHVRIEDDLIENEEIAKDLAEMKSTEWTYLQTPQFSLHASLSVDAPYPSFKLNVRNGRVEAGEISVSDDDQKSLPESSIGTALHLVADWSSVFSTHAMTEAYHEPINLMAAWLNRHFSQP